MTTWAGTQEGTVGGLRTRLSAYLALIKVPQTSLLLLTGLAGYLSAPGPKVETHLLLGLAGSLFLAISGSTILNMVYDRDIDAVMPRTARRPLPGQRVAAREALAVGLGLAASGLAWAIALAPLYGLIILAGLFFDVVVYTVWLKRRTPWSILWGGVAGGMPILAGRALATGTIDITGLLFALAVLLWIPTHILTFSLRHASEYHVACVPVLPNAYGERTTRCVIGFSTCGAALVMGLAASQVGLQGTVLWAEHALGVGLAGLALASAIHPSPRLNLVLFKLASLYMLGSMVLLIAGGHG